MCIYRVDRDSNHVETCWSSLSLWFILYLCVEQFKRVYLRLNKVCCGNEFKTSSGSFASVGDGHAVTVGYKPRNLPLIAIGSGDTRRHADTPRNAGECVDPDTRTQLRNVLYCVQAEQIVVNSNWLGDVRRHADTPRNLPRNVSVRTHLCSRERCRS